MPQNAPQAIAALEKNSRAWLGRNPGKAGRTRSELAKALSSTDAKALNAAIYRASDLSFELSVEGAIRILDGSGDGWPSLGSAVEYFYHSQRLAHKCAKAGGYLYQSIVDPMRFALTTLLAVGLGFSERARWLGKELLQYYDAGAVDGYAKAEPVAHEYWRTLLKVFLAGRWPEPDDAGRALGLYRPLFAESSMPALEKSLLAACEYHLSKTGVEGDDDDPLGVGEVYSWAPFDLMPAELLAYFKLRADLQLPAVSAAHPLLSTPLAKPPGQVQPDGDELLVKLAAAEKSAFGLRD